MSDFTSLKSMGSQLSTGFVVFLFVQSVLICALVMWYCAACRIEHERLGVLKTKTRRTSTSSSRQASGQQYKCNDVAQLLRLRKQGNSSLVISLSPTDDKGQIALALALRASTSIRLSNIPSTKYTSRAELVSNSEELYLEVSRILKQEPEASMPLAICLVKLRSMLRGVVPDPPDHRGIVLRACEQLLLQPELYAPQYEHHVVEFLKDSAYYHGDHLQTVAPVTLKHSINHLQANKSEFQKNYESAIIMFTLKVTNPQAISSILKILLLNYINRSLPPDLLFILNKVLLILCIGKENVLVNNHHLQISQILRSGLQHQNKHVRQEMQFIYWKYQSISAPQADSLHKTLPSSCRRELDISNSPFTITI